MLDHNSILSISSFKVMNSSDNKPFKPTHFGNYILHKNLSNRNDGASYIGYLKNLAHKKWLLLRIYSPELIANHELFSKISSTTEFFASTHCPSIPDIYEVGQVGEKHYLSRSFHPGITIRGLYRLTPAPLPINITAYIVHILCETLIFLEQETPCKHPSLTASNILLTKSGHIKLLDLELLSSIEKPKDTESLFIPNFIAPEVLLYGQKDNRSDVFVVGMLLYELTTGVRIFSDAVNISSVLSRKIRPPHKLIRNFPRVWSTLIMRALEQNPSKRYASCYELIAQMQGLLKKQPLGPSVLKQYLESLNITYPDIPETPSDMKSAALSSFGVDDNSVNETTKISFRTATFAGDVDLADQTMLFDMNQSNVNPAISKAEKIIPSPTSGQVSAMNNRLDLIRQAARTRVSEKLDKQARMRHIAIVAAGLMLSSLIVALLLFLFSDKSQKTDLAQTIPNTKNPSVRTTTAAEKVEAKPLSLDSVLTINAPPHIKISIGDIVFGSDSRNKAGSITIPGLPVGEHTAIFEWPKVKYKDVRTIRIPKEGEIVVNVEIPDGFLAIKTPRNAQITIDGISYGKAPIKPVKLTPGTHKIILRYKGKTYKKNMLVKPLKTITLKKMFRPPPKRIERDTSNDLDNLDDFFDL